MIHVHCLHVLLVLVPSFQSVLIASDVARILYIREMWLAALESTKFHNLKCKIIFVHTVAFWSGAVDSSLSHSYIFRLTAALWVPPIVSGSHFLAQGQDRAAPLIPAELQHCLGRAARGSDRRAVVVDAGGEAWCRKREPLPCQNQWTVASFLCGRQSVPQSFSKWNPLGHQWSWAPAWVWNSQLSLNLPYFPSSASASAAGSSVMFFIEIKISMLSLMDLMSLLVAQICTDSLSF